MPAIWLARAKRWTRRSTLITAANSPQAKAAGKKAVLDELGAHQFQREEHQQALTALLARTGDAMTANEMAALRTLVEAELKRDADQANLMKAADTLKLGMPPVPAKVAFAENVVPGASEWTEAVCEAAFTQYTWFDFKKLRKSKETIAIKGLRTQTVVTDDVMWKLYQFRRHFVDGLIAELHRKYPKEGLLFKSAGSEDIESDLDITVASPGSVKDVDAMRDFNNAVKANSAARRAVCSTTNLYARDYNAIKDTMTKGRDEADAPVDADMAEPKGAMKPMADIDQDVATLMKQRRFMDDESFTKMWQSLRDGIGGETPEIAAENKKRIQQRFEEAEDVYLLTTVDKVNAIIAKIAPQAAAWNEEAAFEKYGFDGAAKLKQHYDEFATMRAEFDAARKEGNLPRTQRLLPRFLDFVEERFEDQVMEVTDEIYADRMAALRVDQLDIERNEALLAAHKEGADCARLHPNQTHQEFVAGVEQVLAGPKARAKQAQFTNIVFANEAYVSQGAIRHIVAGKQAGDPEVLKKIEASELLQSTNEQMADFLKDMKHMAHAEHDAQGATARRRASGEAFVHASKYLARMLEAVVMLQGKYADNPEALAQLTEPKFQLLADAKATDAADLQKKIETKLLTLRKSSTLPGDAKAEMAVAEVMAMFATPDIASLRAKIQAFCLDFNKRVREQVDFLASQTVDEGTEKAYHQAGATG